MRQPMNVCANICRSGFSEWPRGGFAAVSFVPKAAEDGKEIISQNPSVKLRFAPMVNIR